MNGKSDYKVVLLAVILYLMTILLTPSRGAVIRKKVSQDKSVKSNMAFCKYTRFTAAFLGPDYAQYFFLTKISVVNGSVIKEYSRNDIFPSCPYYADAVVYSKYTKKTYIFKGHKVFIYYYNISNKTFEYLGSKVFGRSFPNIPESAFIYNDNIYLLKENYLYLWSEDSNSLVTDRVFPISVLWKDIPTKIEAVFETRNSSSLFFWTRDIRDNMIYNQLDTNKGKIIKSGPFKTFFGFC